MVDRVVECVPHRRIVTCKNVTSGDAMGVGDVRGSELPGVMIVEGMSQSAALLFQRTYGAASPERVPLLGTLKASWQRPARPGDVLTFTIEALKMTSRMGIFRGVARVDGAPIASAELGFAVSQPAGSRQEEVK
jgi:3-hydroxyacyl-[acyl-carrier-protein] dehydratase